MDDKLTYKQMLTEDWIKLGLTDFKKYFKYYKSVTEKQLDGGNLFSCEHYLLESYPSVMSIKEARRTDA